MVRKILNIAIGGLVVLNLVVFGILVGAQPGSAAPDDYCEGQFCNCLGGACKKTVYPPPLTCRYDVECNW